jgi:hypothetical protein
LHLICQRLLQTLATTRQPGHDVCFARAIYLAAYFTSPTLRPIFGPFYSRFWDNLLSGNIDHGKTSIEM